MNNLHKIKPILDDRLLANLWFVTVASPTLNERFRVLKNLPAGLNPERTSPIYFINQRYHWLWEGRVEQWNSEGRPLPDFTKIEFE